MLARSLDGLDLDLVLEDEEEQGFWLVIVGEDTFDARRVSIAIFRKNQSFDLLTLTLRI